MGTTTKAISSDRELLAHFGIPTDGATNFLGRVRAGMEEGLAINDANPQKPYLKHSEIVQLLFFARVLGEVTVNDQAIMEYVASCHKAEEIKSVRLSIATMNEPVEFRKHYGIWVFFPYLEGAIKDGRAEFLKELIIGLDSYHVLTIFLPHSGKKEMLLAFLGEQASGLAQEEDRVKYRYGSFVGTQDTIVLGDPEGDKPKRYIPKRNGGLIREPRRADEVQRYAQIALERTDER